MSIDLDMDNKCIRIDGKFYRFDENIEPHLIFDWLKFHCLVGDFSQPTKESIDVPMDKKIITADKNFRNDLDDEWGAFTPHENEKRLWYGEELYNELCEKYKKQPQSEATIGKDYEIVAYRSVVNKKIIWNKESDGFFHGGVHRFSENALIQNKDEIYSVKRISDNSIWSVGEETNYGKILSFSILSDVHNNNLNVYYDNGLIKGNIFIDSLKKKPTTVDDVNENEWWKKCHPKDKIIFHIEHNPDDWEVEVKDGCYTLNRKKPTSTTVEAPKHEEEKKPILVTEDGVEIYEGEYIYLANLESNDVNIIYVSIKPPLYCRYDNLPTKSFSTKEKAEEYIAQNKKTISYKELLDYCNTNCLISELLEHFKPKS